MQRFDAELLYISAVEYFLKVQEYSKYVVLCYIMNHVKCVLIFHSNQCYIVTPLFLGWFSFAHVG
jgi:hypothetical protein